MLLVFLCLLIITTSVSANVVQGQYKPADLQGCGTIQVSRTGFEIPAQNIAFNGEVCEGDTTFFKNSPLVNQFFSDLVDVLLVATTGELKCGQVEIEYEDYYFFRLKRDPTASEIALAENLLEISLSSYPLRGNVNYLTNTECFWVHQSSNSDPPGSTGSNGPSESDSSSPTQTGGGGGTTCFPASANVQLHDGTNVPMRHLRVGDNVHIGRSQHSSVFTWTHQDYHTKHSFVRLWMKDRKPLVLTSSHYVHLSEGRLVPAGDVKIGDQLVDGKTSLPLKVEHIDQVMDVGLFNPQTIHGDLVVDGVLVSTYTTAIPPTSAHALLSPLRALYKALLYLSPRLSSVLI